ncbi:MAG: cell division protein ZapA [Legionellales bacterium]|nr:cell division protein ZapA [Legionellales bacterium]|tara:strand:+ start:59582 stop:59920 length:339 start_codon:yes stop_codon:yes gene_type:complete
MLNDNNLKNIHILGRCFSIKCAPEQRAKLDRAAAYLEDKMQEIKDSGKVVSYDLMAIMAALNITDELLNRAPVTSPTTVAAPESTTELHALEKKLTETLAQTQVEEEEFALI